VGNPLPHGAAEVRERCVSMSRAILFKYGPKNGYLMSVACLCGIRFDLWVTPREAESDLFRFVSLN
jgi:hypothetical protein